MSMLRLCYERDVRLSVCYVGGLDCDQRSRDSATKLDRSVSYYLHVKADPDRSIL